MNIQNNGATVTINKININWGVDLPLNDKQKLKKVKLAGNVLWEGADADSPSIIPDELPWKGGNRQIAAGTSKLLTMQFQHDLTATGGFSVTVEFDAGCQVNKSN